MVSYPYPLIPTPPGDWKSNIYDLQAIRMAAIHNIFIRALNSVFYHGPNVGPNDVPGFMKYCISLVDSLHEHHTTEETTAFPALEAKLGKGTMDGNVAQHEEFMPKFEEWAKLCKKIAANEAEYNATEFLDLLRASTDVLYPHFVDEVSTLESSILEKHFTEAELRDIENLIEKKVQEQSSIWNAPLIIVNTDLSFNPWFPAIPALAMFILRHVVINCMGDLWKYGQCDKYMRLKDEFKSMYDSN
ncbi:hemerythrin HHE cation-binding domain protein [Rhizoctonia solani AG-3 Rhs1AP]|uniref:Hemerythrin HHE cation-binding domain protein n=1 Tax=Rhizoctonia solani AG-3 Rhs1AP TaxID=1086054 RepID=X8J7J0_9AGAM|nr:hemerythrin HHE cation-binding domain protein [Rhizoctonia solani AG-3 Rhs1AP]